MPLCFRRRLCGVRLGPGSGVFLHLDARLNFHRMFEEAIGPDFSVEAVARHQAEAMDAVGLTGHG